MGRNPWNEDPLPKWDPRLSPPTGGHWSNFKWKLYFHNSNIEEKRSLFNLNWGKCSLYLYAENYKQGKYRPVLTIYLSCVLLTIMLCSILIIYQSSIYASLFIYRILHELINMDGYDILSSLGMLYNFTYLS